MKAYGQLRFSLMTEFKLKAEPQLRSLWADLMELEAAADAFALFVAREQALRRLRALSSAAGAANAREVHTLCDALSLLVDTATQVRDATNYECFDALYKKTRELTGALSAIKAPPPLSERQRQSAETALFESGAEQRRHSRNNRAIPLAEDNPDDAAVGFLSGNGQALPVIVLIISKEEQDLLRSCNLGANSYLRKPVDFEQFSGAVRQLGLYWLESKERPSQRGGAG